MKRLPAQRHWHIKSLAAFSTAAVALTGLAVAPEALATPAEDKLKQAQQQEQAVNGEVTNLEGQLGTVKQQLQEASDKAEEAENAYNDAVSNLVVAEETAKRTEEQAKEANVKVEEARKELASVARTAYTSQGSLSPLSPLLESDGLATAEMRRVAVELFGNKADQQLRSYDSIKKVAEVINQAAQDAKVEKERAAQQVKEQKQAADRVRSQVNQQLNKLNGDYQTLIQKLAQARGATIEAERERQEEIKREEAAREAAAAQAALEAAVKKAQAEAARKAQEAAAAQAAKEGKPAPAANADKPAEGAAAAKGSVTGEQVVEYAKQFLGRPYVFGANGPDTFDCSGLTRYVYRHFGINLPRYSGDQRKVGRQVSRAEAQPGDLVSYNGHVAIYIGNGYMIHAPKPGDHVKISKVYGSPIYKRIL